MSLQNCTKLVFILIAGIVIKLDYTSQVLVRSKLSVTKFFQPSTCSNILEGEGKFQRYLFWLFPGLDCSKRYSFAYVSVLLLTTFTFREMNQCTEQINLLQSLQYIFHVLMKIPTPPQVTDNKQTVTICRQSAFSLPSWYSFFSPFWLH